MADEAINIHILRTKLQRPPLAPDILPRARLLNQLNEERQRTLTLISAPAGYGKSTLASRWVATCESPSGWVSLDERDSDLRTFLSYVLAAIQPLYPETTFRTEALLEAAHLPSAEDVARYLLNDLHRITDTFILVLDDYYHIQRGSPVHDLVTEILAHPPQAMHLVLLTRRDPALPIARLRGLGQLTEIRANDLRFTSAEAAAFLQKKFKIPVDDDTAELLDTKIEGWATGLRLAGLYLQNRKDLMTQVRKLSGSSQHIAEYLAAEVLSKLDPERLTCLIETSILDRFCAPLCREMHQHGKNEGRGQQKLDAELFVQWLVNANLFVVPLDNQGYWFRYHHLFQAFLQNMLRKQTGADRIAELHLIASNWFAVNGLIDEAIQHALAAGDNQVAVRLVVEHRYDLMNNAQYHRLNNWLALLPRDIVAETPLLVTTQAITAWVSGQRGDVATHTEQAKRLLDTLSPESSEYAILQGEILTLHNVVSALSSQPASAWVDAHKALELLPKKALFFQMMAIAEMALCHQMKGDLSRGVKLLKDELKAADLPISIQARGWFYLCIFNYMDCNTSGILLSGLKSVEIADNHRLAHTGGISKYFIGATYYLRNELTKAKPYLLGVLDDCAFTNAIYVTQASGILGFIYLSEGWPEKAESVIEQTVDSAWEMQDNYSPAIRKALRVELALRQGMVDEARRLSIGVDFDILPPTWLLYVPQLTNIKLLLADGTDRSLEDARSRLVDMDQTMRRINRKCVRIDILAILALVCHKMGKQKVALEKLHDALTLAESGGWIRNFVDLGVPMTKLLERLNHVSPGHKFAQQVLEACRAEARSDLLLDSNGKEARGLAGQVLGQEVSTSETAPAPGVAPQPLKEPLTNRELDIVELLARRLQNKEIAEKLSISPATVKTHLQNIYQKLSVKSRRQAVENAEALGILSRH